MTTQASSIGEVVPRTARQCVPIVQRHTVALKDDECRRIALLADILLKNEPALSSTAHFGPLVHCGLHAKGPALLLADQSEISLFGAPEDALLEYRVAALAAPGDMLVLSHDRCEAFERYLDDYLGIQGLDVLRATSGPAERRWPLPKRCLQRAELFHHIAHTSKATGQLSIVPYLSTGHVWNLARRLADETGADIAVTASPPRLARRINDKVWFANRVKQVIGQSALSPAVAVYGPAALAGYVQRMASISDRLVVKIPDSAGSTGNLTLDATMFRGHKTPWIRQRLLEMLMALGWQGTFPLKVELWETPVLSSPSVQIWIPYERDGLPIIEGLFEQVVEGAGGKFVGAIKSRMPSGLQERIMDQAMRLAFLFQQLGYFGRCSMDALITGPDYDAADLHWIECNGRWGGVSVPMTLANRLLSDPQDWQFMIVQKLNLDMPPRPLQTAINAVSDLLFRHDQLNEGIILLTPTSFEHGLGVHFMAIARTLDKARDLASQAMMRLTESPTV